SGPQMKPAINGLYPAPFVTCTRIRSAHIESLTLYPVVLSGDAGGLYASSLALAARAGLPSALAGNAGLPQPHELAASGHLSGLSRGLRRRAACGATADQGLPERNSGLQAPSDDHQCDWLETCRRTVRRSGSALLSALRPAGRP